MRTLRLAVSAALIAGTALLWSAAPVAATSDATVVHGVFTGVTYGTGADTTPASGNWSVITRDGKVTATFNIFVDGAHHLSYGVPPKAMEPGSTGSSFSFMTGASSNPLVVTITGDRMTYRLAPYALGDQSYDVVTYYGTVTD